MQKALFHVRGLQKQEQSRQTFFGSWLHAYIFLSKSLVMSSDSFTLLDNIQVY